MADPSHLEKMGRELKCPICLSLLNSSVSLTCNHVFCNSCIMKSMKSGSNCPVCKVPFQRREVRPAPHMDNLVNIYKSMEVASGINLFVTQNVSTTKLSDGEQQPEGDHNYGVDTHGICQDGEDDKISSKGRQTRKTKKCTPKSSGPTSAKPSFPTKKRVQVPQYPLSETPTRTTTVEGCLGETSVKRCKSSSTRTAKKLSLNEKKDSVYTPFFWLRDVEDEENLSQQSDKNLSLDNIPTPNVPSFSDIKDSEDESPSKLSPGEVHGESNIADFFDSEMFDWTQRACSPELCSSPIKGSQVAKQGLSVNGEPHIGDEDYMNFDQGDNMDVVLPHLSSPGIKHADDCIKRKKSNKRSRKAKQQNHKKCAKRTKAETLEIHVDPKEGSENLDNKQAGNKNDSCLPLEEINTSPGAHFDISACEPTPENTSNLSGGKESMHQGNKNSVANLPSLGNKFRGGKKFNMKKSGKNGKKFNTKMQKDFPAGSNERKLDSEHFRLQAPAIRDQINNDSMPQSSIHELEDKNASAVGERLSKHVSENKSSKCLKGNQRSRCKNVSFKGSSRDELIDNNQVQDNVSEILTRVTQPLEKVQPSSGARVLNDSSTEEKLTQSNGFVLHKCKINTYKIRCAFCHSSEVSEASGEMVHYCNGRPVAADHAEGSKVIHSHRNCAEWAPNVYFEGDTIINLEAELTRSRRITCSCCGIKGAALGCYEKSCRKSFHVPCAKLIPQCQWDSENFVMLCPLHPSSKLPTKTSSSHERGRKRCTVKRQSHSQDDQVPAKQDNSRSQNWNPGRSPNKYVLCCSALTLADKETISGFKKLSGVMELKKWNSTVTHVIASTDENGACRRTLKILMGIMEGKWILSVQWVKACMKARGPVNEEPYEITVDIHGVRDGPRLGRLRSQNKQPKLFHGLKFYLMGDFAPAYKGYLQELVSAAGGSILHRRPISSDQDTVLGCSSSSTFIIYSQELPDDCDISKKNMILKRRQSDAKALASSTGTKVASNSWVLDSIAACKLQNLAE